MNIPLTYCEECGRECVKTSGRSKLCPNGYGRVRANCEKSVWSDRLIDVDVRTIPNARPLLRGGDYRTGLWIVGDQLCEFGRGWSDRMIAGLYRGCFRGFIPLPGLRVIEDSE